MGHKKKHKESKGRSGEKNRTAWKNATFHYHYGTSGTFKEQYEKEKRNPKSPPCPTCGCAQVVKIQDLKPLKGKERKHDVALLRCTFCWPTYFPQEKKKRTKREVPLAQPIPKEDYGTYTDSRCADFFYRWNKF